MKSEPIIIVAGEPNSVFLETFFKCIKKKKFKKPIILICSLKILKFHMNKLNFKKKIRFLDGLKTNFKYLDNKYINLINVEYNSKYSFKKISKSSRSYIKKSFDIAFEIIKSGISKKLINGPISKKNFLNKNYLGMTEYISDKFLIKKKAMLIFNHKLSVCPITTHLPIKQVSKNINKKIIEEKVNLVNNFYKSKFRFKPKIAILGLNPHCETIDSFNEDEKIIVPTINILKKKGYKVSGPYPADTIFIKKNRKKFNVIMGMYHDQVLSPLKTIFEYNAINITLGLPFERISPDHGPNEKMLGKNISNPTSLMSAINFLEKN